MKKGIVAFALSALIFTACKEKSPYIQLTPGTPVGIDSTYVLPSVPAADPHNVLVEDFTGASCSNCPAAHSKLVTIEAAHPGRINVVSLHVTDFNQSEPVRGSSHNFMDSTATLIEQNIFSPLQGMPVAGFDRMMLGDAVKPYQVLSPSWDASANSELAINDSINLLVSSTYDTSTGYAVITTTVTYLGATATAHNLSIAIVEDGFIDRQEDGSEVDTFYHFDDVFRTLVTGGPVGDPILPSMASKEAGRVALKSYVYNIKALQLKKTDLNPRNCRVIAFVTGSLGTHVYQSWQCKLVP